MAGPETVRARVKPRKPVEAASDARTVMYLSTPKALWKRRAAAGSATSRVTEARVVGAAEEVVVAMSFTLEAGRRPRLLES
ncbi:hypothetical protein GCM10010231_18610 [Streptomyces sindenensis]|nr:hypothetical protein GCM10010231_18610 [Streptomyces sindenensis]